MSHPKYWPLLHQARLWWHLWRHHWHQDHDTPGYAWIAQARAQRIEQIRRKEG